ncbi:hypothetical protein [Escherichia coli]|uniref:hypothetical protein n=1 Tax=Escherichia coli TaxID=562 RepID=UPI002738CEF5|nr:hypothetical protein [Escherichia coli]
MHFAQRVRALVVLNGVALLPQFACKQGLVNGELVRLFAPWSGIPRLLHEPPRESWRLNSLRKR